MHSGSDTIGAPSVADNRSTVDLFLFGVALSCLTGGDMNYFIYVIYIICVVIETGYSLFLYVQVLFLV